MRTLYSYIFMLISAGVISLLMNDAAAIAGSNNRGVMLAAKQSLNATSTQKRRYTSVRRQQGRVVLDTKTPEPAKSPVSSRATTLKTQPGKSGITSPTAKQNIKSIKLPISGVSKVQNPRASFGGAETETLGKAERRPPATLRHRNRAVSKEDYKKIGNDSPGGTVDKQLVVPISQIQKKQLVQNKITGTGKKPDQNNLKYQSLDKATKKRVAKQSPQWSDQRNSDPGKTILNSQPSNKQFEKNIKRNHPSINQPISVKPAHGLDPGMGSGFHRNDGKTKTTTKH